MLGIDIVEIQRIEDAYKRFGDRFAKRILSETEYEILKSKKNFIQSMAGRFASKEAFVKATGKKDITFNELTVRNTSQGKPYFEHWDNLELSISHERNYAVAVVIKR